MAPPERPARLQTASVLPPAPTISSRRTRVDREPEITAIRATTPSDDDSASSDNNSDHTNESQDHSEDRSANSGSDTDGIDAQSPETSAAPLLFGPPSRSKQQHSEPVADTAAISDHSILDVKMHSPPHALSSQRGRARIVKPIGSSSRPQPVKSSGASKPFGATIGGRALGNAPNIGDFDLAEDDSPFIDIEGTVNLFASNARPTTLDIDETAVIAVTIPYEGELGPLLQHIAKYYSPMSGKYFKFCLKLKLKYFR